MGKSTINLGNHPYFDWNPIHGKTCGWFSVSLLIYNILILYTCVFSLFPVLVVFDDCFMINFVGVTCVDAIFWCWHFFLLVLKFNTGIMWDNGSNEQYNSALLMYSVMLLPMADGNSGICFKHCLLEIIDICPAKCGEDGPWLPCGLYIWFCFHVFFSKPSNVVGPIWHGADLAFTRIITKYPWSWIPGWEHCLILEAWMYVKLIDSTGHSPRRLCVSM